MRNTTIVNAIAAQHTAYSTEHSLLVVLGAVVQKIGNSDQFDYVFLIVILIWNALLLALNH